MAPNITGLEFYFDALSELSTSRQTGLSVSPIPFTAIIEFAKIYDICDLDDFLYVIRRLDRVYLELNAQEKSAKGDK